MKKVLVVGVAFAFALPVLAQDGQHITVAASKDGATTTSFHGPVAPGGGSAVLFASAVPGARLSFGVPKVYTVLGLTDEQKKTIESISKEAQTEYRQAASAAYKQGSQDKSQGASTDVYVRQASVLREKQAEISQKCDARIAEVLTPEQKTLLGKIRDLAAQKSAEDRKIDDVAAAARKEVLDSYRKKLYAVLPADQARKIEDEDQPQKPKVVAPDAPKSVQGK